MFCWDFFACFFLLLHRFKNCAGLLHKYMHTIEWIQLFPILDLFNIQLMNYSQESTFSMIVRLNIDKIIVVVTISRCERDLSHVLLAVADVYFSQCISLPSSHVFTLTPHRLRLNST